VRGCGLGAGERRGTAASLSREVGRGGGASRGEREGKKRERSRVERREKMEGRAWASGGRRIVGPAEADARGWMHGGGGGRARERRKGRPSFCLDFILFRSIDRDRDLLLPARAMESTKR
jgi:hypothetical protein